MNTNQEKRMDKERIAELREEIARNKATGYHDEGIGTFDSPTMDAALDAIEAAQAELATAREALLESLEAHQVTQAEGGALQQANTEIDRLRAELAALRGQAGGVVPEPTADEWREIAENARSADMVDFLAGAAAYGLWLRGKTLPSSRVAGVVPDRAAWLTVEEMANALVMEFGTPLSAARGFAKAIAEASKAKALRATKGKGEG